MTRVTALGPILLVAVVAAGCSNEPDPAASTSTPPTVTTSTTTVTTIPVPTTTTTLPAEPTVDLLIAGAGGIDLIADGVPTPLLRGRSIAVAVPDLAGGVVFQEAGQYEMEWPPHPLPIEWIPAVGDDPVVLVDGAGANALTPIQVSWIEGHRQLLYRRMTVLDPDGEQIEHLVMRALASGEERVIGITGSFESSWTGIDVAADRVAIAWGGYAGAGACAGVTNLGDLLALQPSEWVSTVCTGDCCALGPTPGCGFGVPCDWGGDVAMGSLRAALSPDGASLALATSLGSGGWAVDEVDVTMGGTRRVVEASSEGEWVLALDYDGTDALVTLLSPDDVRRAVLVAGDGRIEELPDAGAATFWAEEPQPLPWLRGGGLGPADFDTPMDEALDLLVPMLGPPGSERVEQGPWSEGSACQVATGYACTGYFRAVDWPDQGIGVIFFDDDGGTVRLQGWRYWGGHNAMSAPEVPPTLTTASGLTAPTTVSDLRARVDDPTFGDFVCGGCCAVQFDDGEGVIAGELSGEPDVFATRVTMLSGGASSSC